MAEPTQDKGLAYLTAGRYTLQPARSFLSRLTLTLLLGVICVAAGAAAAWYWQQREAQQRVGQKADCEQAPSEVALQEELKRLQLALTKEESARAALQKIADDATAEADRLGTQLRFLRNQRKK